MLWKKSVGAILLTSILFSISFANWNSGLVIYFFLVPYLLVSNNFSRRRLFFSGWFLGFLAQGLNLIWLIPTIINGGAGVILAIAGWVGLSLYCGLYFGVFFWLNKILTANYQIEKIFSGATLWVILEYIRGHIFNGFPFGIVGYAPVKYSLLISPAKFGAVYAVSFLIISFNLAIAQLFLSRNKIKSGVVLVTLTILNITPGLLPTTPVTKKNFRVALLQGNIPQQEKFNQFYRDKIIAIYANLVDRAEQKKPDLIIWPETAWPDILDTPDGKILNIKNRTFQLIGALTRKNGKYYNSALLLNPEQKIIWEHHKIHLVPFGEFIPFRNLVNFINYFQTYEDITAGEKIFQPAKIVLKPNSEKTLNELKLGVTICSENFFPEISQRWAKNGADIIVNITNDAWFGNTSALPQHFAMNILRAAETGLPIAVAGNSGITGIILPSGEIKSNLVVYQVGYLAEEFVSGNYPTFYRKYGDRVFFVIIFLVLAITIIRNRRILC